VQRNKWGENDVCLKLKRKMKERVLTHREEVEPSQYLGSWVGKGGGEGGTEKRY